MGSTLPAQGRPREEILRELEEMRGGDVDWRSGKAAVFVFHAGEDVARVQKEAYTSYMSENGLGPMAFPSLRRMEDEVLANALEILHGPAGSCGAMTSGGTDSITMAMKAARDRHATRSAAAASQTRPNLVLPRSGHPAFEKAAEVLQVEVRRVPIDPVSCMAIPEEMAAAINDTTIMMVGSAPNFPHGIIDPIGELSQIALERNVWLHVDACVGGFLAPFARDNGANVPAFDFELEGVCSMSADLHKYGYAAKGASTVLYRSAELYDHMPFDHFDWSGARLTTPTLAGTRPGGAIAAAWAVMQYLGKSGYREKQAAACRARARIQAGVQTLGFEIVGDPQLALLAFRHPDHDSFSLWGKLLERGWFTSITTEPPSLHLMLSPFHDTVVPRYLEDLEAILREMEAGAAGTAPEPRYN